MEISDLVRVEITDKMRSDAETFAEQVSWAREAPSHHKTYSKSKHDVVGYLAHKVVEMAFDRYKLKYESEIKATGGDDYDILYDGDTIDVKGTHGELDEEYFYNKQFLVMQHQIDRGKLDNIAFLCFVLVGKHEAYIYGVIEVDDFLELAEYVGSENTNGYIKFKNKGIRAHRLTPFRDYAFRTK